MWYIEKKVVISAGHHLKNYDGACANRHGHNWNIVVFCKGDKLDSLGMLIDFKKIKEAVNYFDHRYLNDLFPEGENPIYKAGNQRYTAGVLRGHLQSRTMAAISKKYWEIMGSTHIKRENINQMNFDFLQEKLNAKL